MSAAAAVFYVVTAYCPSYACGALDHGITKSGVRAVEGVTIACPPELPFGTRLAIEGVGVRTCEDRGPDIVGRRLDLFVGSMAEADRGLARARAWGRGGAPRRVRVLSRPGQRAKALTWDRPGCPGEDR